MKNFHLLIVILLFIAATLPYKNAAAFTPTIYQQLCGLNKYWQQHPVFNHELNRKYRFTNHEALISYHLMQVEQYLRQNPPAHLSGKQKENRKHCLDLLHTYRQAGVFPKNTRHNITIPYFIDDFNTACAVGHLIRETGYEAVACRIAGEMNYAYLEEMPYPEINQWANTMGFDVAELKWIQPAYAPPVTIQHSVIPASCGQQNGSVNLTVVDYITQMPVSGYEQKWYSLNGNMVGLAAQTEDLQNMPSGLYKAVVITNQGMYPVVYDLIGLGNNSSLNVSANIQNETCTNSKDGSITLSLTGGTPPYSVRWYNQSGEMISTDQSLQNLSGLGYSIMFEILVAQYTAEITDANGCKTFESYNLQTLYEASYMYPNITKPSCGLNNGTVELLYVPTGAQIAWSHNPGLNETVATNLASGVYTITVTTQNGCETVTDVQVSDEGLNFITSIAATPEYCGQSNGSLTLPNIPDVTYSWSHNPAWHEHFASNLPSGYYTVTITNNSGCQQIQSFYISNSEPYLYQQEPLIMVNANSINGTLGSIELSNYPDGMLGFSWSHDAALNGPVASNLAPGIYSVTITNTQTGCSIAQQYQIYDQAFLGTYSNNPPAQINANLAIVGQNLFLRYYYVGKNTLQLQVFNLMGKPYHAQNLGVGTGAGEVNLPLETLPAGMYLVQISNGLTVQSLKFVK